MLEPAPPAMKIGPLEYLVVDAGVRLGRQRFSDRAGDGQERLVEGRPERKRRTGKRDRRLPQLARRQWPQLPGLDIERRRPTYGAEQPGDATGLAAQFAESRRRCAPCQPAELSDRTRHRLFRHGIPPGYATLGPRVPLRGNATAARQGKSAGRND